MSNTEHKEIIFCLESISGKEMTLDNFMLFMKEILPNGYTREYTKDELSEGFDQQLLNLNS